MRKMTWLNLIVAAALAGCGGGGGADTAGGGTNSVLRVPTGLVPAAPAMGSVLYADASAFRPLAAGANWAYRDVASTSLIEVLVSQRAAADGSIIESRSDDTESPTTLTTGTGGRIDAALTIPLAPFKSIQLSGTELPATLHANEQFTVVDQQVTDSAVDVDRDGVQDAFDVAVWRRVIGNDPVVLPSLAQPMDAVRIDTWALVRVRPSSSGAAVTQSSRIATWYARGFGVVREATFGPDESLPFRTDERLLGMELNGRGYGYVTRREQRAQGDGVLIPPLGRAESVLQLTDGALVSTSYRTNPSLARLDKSGVLRAVHPFIVGGVLPIMRGMLNLNVGIRALIGDFPTFTMISLTDDGQVVESAPTRQFDLSNGRPGIISESIGGIVHQALASRFWAVWTRMYSKPGTGAIGAEIVLREISADGSLPSGEIRIAVDGPAIYDLRTVAFQDGVALTYSEPDMVAGGWYNRYLVIDRLGNVQVDKKFVINDPTRMPSSVASLLAAGSDVWLAWTGPSATDPTASLPHAWRLDASGAVVGTGADVQAALAAVVSPLDTTFNSNWPSKVAVANGQWFAVGSGFGPVYPGHAYPRRFITFGQFDPGASSVTGSVRALSNYTIPLEPANALTPLVFDDRVLLLADDGYAMRPTVIWK